MLEALGADKLVSRLDNAGVRLALSDKPNPAIALGAAGIRLEQLVALYSALTRQGAGGDAGLAGGGSRRCHALAEPGAAWIIW